MTFLVICDTARAAPRPLLALSATYDVLHKI